MNWITRNNYTIKRKFNQFDLDKKKRNKINENDKMPKKDKDQNKDQNPINIKNQINFNISAINHSKDKNNLYSNIYYQINGNDNLEHELKKGENIIQNNLNCKYILSELSEF